MTKKPIHRELSTGHQYKDDGVMLVPLPIAETCGGDWSDHDWVTYKFIEKEYSDKFCKRCGIRPIQIPDGCIVSVMGKDGDWVEITPALPSSQSEGKTD